MTSFWEMQAELRQQELLEDAQTRRISSAPRRRRQGRIFSLTLPRIRRSRAR
ncbi:MAG TPA: hypothetical protein VJ975_02965 [Candidatus Limnocylindria bacterium]|nr:hypothetical protein [Candidatus Limnocylindria bacterium]